MTHPTTRPFVWMLCGTVAFSVMVEFAHDLMQKTAACDWQTVAIARSSLAAVFAGLMAWAAGARLVFWPWRLWVRSLAGSLSMVATFYAFGKLPGVDVVTLTNTFPIWVAVLSWPLYGKAPGLKMWAAILMGVVGVVLVEQPQLAAGNRGVVSALLSAMVSAVAMLGLHSLRGIDPRAIVVHFSSVATIFCVGAFFFFPRRYDPARVLELPVLLKLLAMGLSATAGQICLTQAFKSGPPTKVSVVGLTQIVIVFLMDLALWENQTVNAGKLVGTALVIAPTAWLLTRPAAADVHDPVPGEPEPAQVAEAEKVGPPVAASDPAPSLRP